MKNTCIYTFIGLLILVASHSVAFYQGTQNTLTFKIESREGEIVVDEKPHSLDKTKHKKKLTQIDTKSFDELVDCVTNRNCNEGL